MLWKLLFCFVESRAELRIQIHKNLLLDFLQMRFYEKKYFCADVRSGMDLLTIVILKYKLRIMKIGGYRGMLRSWIGNLLILFIRT